MFLVLPRWTGEEMWLQDFFLSPQGFESLRSHLLQKRKDNLVLVECLSMTNLMVVGFCSIRGDTGFENNCKVWGKRVVSGFIPRIYRWVYKTLKFSLLVVKRNYWWEHSFKKFRTLRFVRLWLVKRLFSEKKSVLIIPV